MAIKQFRAFCAKFDLIASKLVPLFKTQNDVNEIKFYLNTTDGVQMVVVPITLAKQEEHYMKGHLNILGLMATALCKHRKVSNIRLKLHLYIRHYLCHHHLFKTVKIYLKNSTQ